MGKSRFETSSIVFFTVLAISIAALFLIQPMAPQGTIKLAKEYPKDFNFSLSFGVEGKNKVDTYKKILTKDLVTNGTKTANFKMTEDMKKDIYNKVRSIDVVAIPNDLNSNTEVYSKPNCDYIFTMTANGMTKTIKYTEAPFGVEGYLNKEQTEFMKLVEYVQARIYETKEYKDMPEAVGGYL